MVKCSVSRKNGKRCFQCGNFAVEHRLHSLAAVPHTSTIHVRSTVAWWRRVCCGCRACSAGCRHGQYTAGAAQAAHDARRGFAVHTPSYHNRSLSMTISRFILVFIFGLLSHSSSSSSSSSSFLVCDFSCNGSTVTVVGLVAAVGCFEKKPFRKY